MNGSIRRTTTTPPVDDGSAHSPLARRIANLLTDVVRGPVLRWRVEKPNGALVHSFPGYQAMDEAAARALAKQRLTQMGAWRDSYVVRGIR